MSAIDALVFLPLTSWICHSWSCSCITGISRLRVVTVPGTDPGWRLALGCITAAAPPKQHSPALKEATGGMGAAPALKLQHTVHKGVNK
jgi:hypothetical protein